MAKHNPEENKGKSDTEIEHIISLMGIYLEEWEHREQFLWKQTFQLFYANLIVIFLPNITGFLKIELPEINGKIFQIIGIFMSLVFLYLGIGYAQRSRASSLSYETLINLLGKEEYKRIPLRNKDKLPYGWLFSCQMSLLLVIVMFVSLIIISLYLILI